MALRAAPFFVLRTPLLPFDEFRAFGEGLTGAIEKDRELLRERLARLLERPEVSEAVFVASSSLASRLAKWRDKPEGKDGQKIETALVRYLTRMTSRPTPFGLFSGCSLGAIAASPTRLVLGPPEGDRRCVRLDFSYLTGLAEAVERDPAIRRELRYVPNSGMYRVGDTIHYSELVVEEGVRRFALSAVEWDAPLEKVLARARGGATIAELADVLVGPEVGRADAEEYVGQLVDAGVLECEARPPITVPDGARALATELAHAKAAAPVHEALEHAAAELDALNARPLGEGKAAYDAIAERLEKLPGAVKRERLFQVDMMRSSPEATLGPEVLAEIVRGVAALHRLNGASSENAALQTFARAFAERYEEREVPILEALDEEVGVGYSEPGGYTQVAAPILATVPFPAPQGGPSTVAFGPTEALLVRKLEEHWTRGGKGPLVLEEADVDRLPRSPLPLPGSFAAVATLLGAGADFKVHLHYASGPSGARMLGRFCPWDEELTRRVRDLLQEEERQKDAIFAEVVFHPQASRIGNILVRPAVREHEIVFHARSGVEQNKQIPLADLTVSIRKGRVVLRSRSRGREVVPRLTTAHNFAARQLGVYRFLCRLQDQGVASAVGFSWSIFGAAKHLPRVELGKVVLSPERWRLDKGELAALAQKTPADRMRAVSELRASLAMPRIIALHDGDNVLPVDLDNSLSVDAFVDVVHDRSEAQISEALDHVLGATATGRGGSFVHELVVPFTNGAPAKASAARARKPKIAASLARELVPGSEWLYTKLYCGEATADEILTRVVQPFVKDALGSKAIDRWFFIRYADPRPHLRVRVHGQPAALAKLLPELAERLAPFTRSGRVWKVQADTYVREMERYGGPVGMPICEALFGCDSDAAARIVALGCTERERWGALLVSIDAMLKDFGLDLEARAQFEEKRAADFAREFRMQGDYEHGLAKAYRRERAYVEALLSPKEGESEVLARARKVIEARSRANAPHVRVLRAAEREKRLALSVEAILASLVHMTVIRMTRSYPRQQELVLHTYLSRTYESMIARERKKKGTEAVQ